MTALLLSGGMDSIALLYWKRPDIALTIDYGQKCAEAEIKSSRYVCEQLKIEHHVLRIDGSVLGSGDMSNEKPHQLAPQTDWWPYRNQFLITLAAMYLIKFETKKILIGSVKTDRQFKDGTKKFIQLINELILYQEGNITVDAPALNMSTSELILKSQIPRSLLYCAHSCHTGNIACGGCRGCQKYILAMDQINGINWN
ncbi:MAG: 7-cyano-7-deazaguanine synthase [Campylobacterales bacterium]|nr:7-cyano-7-deazaguanine synthase [Campylobacterales bacterium]